jgi:S-DNA-T family DNA segregation ATPase FtsK/SpoIIIE
LSDLIVYKVLDLLFPVCSIIFLTGIFLILGISANRLESGSGIYCYYCFVRFIWFFATSVPELGGTVGYELNLFLQDYMEKQGHS